MTERLKQIWSGFEGVTTRNLTGSGVDNIVVPSRVDYQAEDQSFLPETFNAPAHAAFAELHSTLTDNKKRFGRKKKEQAEQAEPVEVSASVSFGPEDLFQGLEATAWRVERTEMNYQHFLSSGGAKALETLGKKKKRFIFF